MPKGKQDFVTFYHFPDKDKIRGLMVDFLVDKGADVSAINYKTFQYLQEMSKTKIKVHPWKGDIKSINNSQLNFQGYGNITFAADIDNTFTFTYTFLVGNEGNFSCKGNVLGKDFIHRFVKTIEYEKQILCLNEPYEGNGILIERDTKTFPFCKEVLACHNEKNWTVEKDGTRLIRANMPKNGLELPAGTTFNKGLVRYRFANLSYNAFGKWLETSHNISK